MRPLYDEAGVVVTAVVSRQTRELIDQAARARGLTRSEVVRMALEAVGPVMEDMAK